MRLSSALLLLPASAVLASSLRAQCLDQNAPVNNTCMAGYGQTDLAQSFQQTAGTITGAGVFLTVATGSPEPLWIQLWDALPNAGGTMLASGAGQGIPGTWFEVQWPSVNITPNTTYYLVFAGTATMCYAGDDRNGYPNGIAYANLGYRPFPNYDYTFRTYAFCGPVLTKTGNCPGAVRLDVSGGTPNGLVALLSGGPGSFVKNGNPCDGLMLALAQPSLAAMRSANASGALSLNFTAPPGACGRTLQAVDVSACAPTNAVLL